MVSSEENLQYLKKLPSEELTELLTVNAPPIGPVKPKSSYSLVFLRRR